MCAGHSVVSRAERVPIPTQYTQDTQSHKYDCSEDWSMWRRKRCQREIEGGLSLRKAVSGMAGLSEEIAFEEEPAWQRRREGMFQAEGRSREAGMFQKQEGGAAGPGGVGVRGRSQGRGHDWQVSMRVWVLFQSYRRNGSRGLKPCWL